LTLHKIYSFILEKWNREAGYKQVILLAIPLILSTTSLAIQQFVDRMFLAWYSAEAIAATMPAGILNFTIINLFIGTAGYVGTFVAQYWGASHHRQIGPILWQGFYVAIIATIVHMALIPLAVPFFGLVGHSPEVQRLEIIYFQIICLGAGPAVAIAAIAGFFTGQGKTKIVMIVSVMGNIINVVLNYLLIFGHLGLPRLGVKGAAIATVISNIGAFVVFLALIFSPGHEAKYRILSGWRPNFRLFTRLLRFGLPNGLQYFVIYMSVSVFILLVGRLGTIKLAATNIAFNINMLAFMPMMGFGMAVMILVGQYQGKGRPDLSEKSVYSGFHLTYIYMMGIAATYVLFPGFFLWPFSVKADPESFTSIKEIATVLLRFIAVYSLFDTMNIICSSGIKGAGDTRFVMLMTFFFSLLGLAIPTYLVLNVFNLGLYAAWTVITVYIVLLSFAFLARFLSGKWKTMRVIEKPKAIISDEMNT